MNRAYYCPVCSKSPPFTTLRDVVAAHQGGPIPFRTFKNIIHVVKDRRGQIIQGDHRPLKEMLEHVYEYR